jgi:hypothetical protein
MRIAAFLLIFAGSVGVALSFIWPLLYSAESHWTEEQAEAHAKAGTHFHRIALGGTSHAKGQPHSRGKAAEKSQAQSELEAARLRWEESKAALDAAQAKGPSRAGWLRYGGAAIALVGVAGLALAKKQVPKSDRPDPFVLLD